jgi:hypothetical protein
VEIQGMQISAVIDTAAMVTLVSTKFYSQFGDLSKLNSKVVLCGLGEKLEAYQIPSFKFKLGTKLYTWNICVAEMRDEINLGLDFLNTHECSISVNLILIRSWGV